MLFAIKNVAKVIYFFLPTQFFLKNFYFFSNFFQKKANFNTLRPKSASFFDFFNRVTSKFI